MFSLVTALAAAALAQETAPTPAQIVDTLTCTRFEWSAIDGRERGAIKTPVVIDGVPMMFQLDTASEASILYGAAGRVARFSAGGIDLPPMYFAGRPQAQVGGGTLGLDAFVGRVAVIDYPGQRLCLMAQADFPYALYRRTRWADATLRTGRLFVPVTLNGQVERDFFFDTGSSLFPVAVDLERWQALTGRTSTANADDVVEGKAWGEPVRVVGAPLTGSMSIAGVDVAAPKAFVRETEPRFMAETQENADGLIGNAAVWDHVVVLYLGARPRFGIVE